MSEEWRNLRVGDRIRFLRMPSKYSEPDYRVPPETLALYTLLISTGDSVEIEDFLDNGVPIAGYVDSRNPDSPEFHSLTIDDIDDSCWVRVSDCE